ncbi:NAD(P)-binding protein [Zopfia rhizophila CBS 207.26]|uniref:NAD(P)-binding protein n=1 Tax=Zopfia rhizophila CBS 207.26 TaxID=1314779 RepID=A0A6A6D8J0_9PEZI|nr:NAD(P)-binding protein [Zopfia rhizophila CBS 207.26]
MGIVIGIAGITGQFAQLLTLELVKNSGVTLRAYCRNAAKVSQSMSSTPNLEIIQGGAFDREQVSKFVKGCDIVVCCYQGDDELMIDGQKVLIDACEKGKVPRYMASDWSLDYTKLEFGQLFTKDPMKHVKAYIETKSFVKGVHVLNGVFFETLFNPYFGIYDSETHTFSHWGEPGVLFEGTSYGNSAEFTSRVILNKDAVGVQRFVGDCKSMDDIAQSFEKVYGVKTNVVVKGSARELCEMMWNLRNQPSSQPNEYMAMFYQHYMVNEQTYVGPYYDNLKYPDVKAVSYEVFMRGVPLDQLPAAYQNPVVSRLQDKP